jgi:3-deoxy-D-manno-octulosonate 8-phosphate phosphatase (KDO 8-P phosphatase)
MECFLPPQGSGLKESLDRQGRIVVFSDKFRNSTVSLGLGGPALNAVAVRTWRQEEKGAIPMTKNVGFLEEPGKKERVKTPSVLNRVNADVRERVERVKLLVLDVDGVLTDGRLFYHDDGTESKAFDVRDGHGIKMLRHAGIESALISGRSCPMVEKRAADLGITEVTQGVRDKAPILKKLLSQKGLKPEHAAFVGDDVVDLTIMNRVGFAVAVADASEFLFDTAHYVTLAPGGRGAVREVAELILGVQGLWDKVASMYFD